MTNLPGRSSILTAALGLAVWVSLLQPASAARVAIMRDPMPLPECCDTALWPGQTIERGDADGDKVPAHVPEPASLLMLAVGAVGVTMARRAR